MTDKKDLAGYLIEKNGIKSMSDIQKALKDLLGGMIQGCKKSNLRKNWAMESTEIS